MALPAITLMQADEVGRPFHREGWVYEEKYDGWRMVADKDGTAVRHPCPMAYGANIAKMHRQVSASLVDKILRGAQPANLPVAQPTEWELVINLRTTKALGLTIPPSLLQRADQVIE